MNTILFIYHYILKQQQRKRFSKFLSTLTSKKKSPISENVGVPSGTEKAKAHGSTGSH